MSVHRWQRKKTQYFNEVWVPVARIELKSGAGVYQPIVCQVDSGAVVSLLRSSIAGLLGLKLEDGRAVQLGSVGGAKTTCYLHEIHTRFDQGIEYPVPYAIAATENVPNLLGRLGVFDTLQIDFDATLEETRITTQWLSPDGRRIYDAFLGTERHILARWQDIDLPEPAPQVARYFVQRAAQLLADVTGLMKLHRAYAGPLYIRMMFELSLQFDFIMDDPEERAQRYLDFTHVTRYKQSQAVVKNPDGYISRTIAESPLRAEGERRNAEEYERVLPQFKRHPKGVWDKWYCMSIRELAERMGRLGEYNVLYRTSCSFAHGDPFSMREGEDFRSYPPEVVYCACCGYYARILRRVATKLILTNEQHELLEALAEGMS